LSKKSYIKKVNFCLSDNTTQINIKIYPHIFKVLFFLTFPAIFIPVAIFSDQMTINGEIRMPEFSERIFFALFGGGIPLVWLYFDSIRPIKRTESWIRNELELEIKDLPS